MKKTLTYIVLAAAFATPGIALAAGTPSNTAISNTATATYQFGGVPQPAISTGPSATFVVDNKVNLTVTRNADALVASGSANQALSFSITNNGNTAQRYALSIVSRATDSFDMNNVRIYRDNNANNVYDAGTDTLYANAGTFGDIAADGTLRVLIVADTPAGQTNSATAVYDLVATTVDAGALNVTASTAGPNTAGVDTVFADAAGSNAGDAARDGKHSALGTYTISDVTAVVNKAVLVIDQQGGTRPVPGATLRYTLTVTVTGIGTATGVRIADPVPANTTYTAGSLRLNVAPLSDAGGDDAGDVGATAPNTVTVNLGNMTSASPAQTITFDVRIN
jgi:uncharacterized repeat protein (TIGR01451 family)